MHESASRDEAELLSFNNDSFGELSISVEHWTSGVIPTWSMSCNAGDKYLATVTNRADPSWSSVTLCANYDMIKQLKPWQKWQEKNSHYHKHPVSSELLEAWLMTINWREIFSISWWDYLNFPFPKGFMPDKNSSTIVMQCSSQNLTCTCTALIHLFQQGKKMAVETISEPFYETHVLAVQLIEKKKMQSHFYYL